MLKKAGLAAVLLAALITSAGWAQSQVSELEVAKMTPYVREAKKRTYENIDRASNEAIDLLNILRQDRSSVSDDQIKKVIADLTIAQLTSLRVLINISNKKQQNLYLDLFRSQKELCSLGPQETEQYFIAAEVAFKRTFPENYRDDVEHFMPTIKKIRIQYLSHPY